jgi:hypothetical protein
MQHSNLQETEVHHWSDSPSTGLSKGTATTCACDCPRSAFRRLGPLPAMYDRPERVMPLVQFGSGQCLFARLCPKNLKRFRVRLFQSLAKVSGSPLLEATSFGIFYALRFPFRPCPSTQNNGKRIFALCVAGCILHARLSVCLLLFLNFRKLRRISRLCKSML